MKSETEEIDYIIIGDGKCPRCGKQIPDPKQGGGDAVMCECTVWFVSQAKNVIVCKNCPNLIIKGRVIRCKACNIKRKLELDKNQCILKDLALLTDKEESEKTSS